MKKIFLTIGVLFLLCNTSDAGTLGSIDGQGSYGSKVISALPNPVAHYKLNDNAATKTVIDETGNHNGTSVRNTSLMSVAGKINTALDFDGADDKIDCASDFIGTKALTICAWIYPEGWGESSVGRIVDNGKLLFTVKSADTVLRLFSDGATATLSASGAIGLNQWQFVAGTRTAAGVANLYVNGELSGTANQDSGTPAAGSNVIIGNSTASAYTFDGYIDDVRIYDRILTQRQISKIYNGGRGTER